jgi:hypothetical protein
MPAAFVWLPLAIGPGVCRRGYSSRQQLSFCFVLTPRSNLVVDGPTDQYHYQFERMSKELVLYRPHAPLQTTSTHIEEWMLGAR